MHYIFLDESYPRDGKKTIIIAGWIVEQNRFSRFCLQPAGLHHTPVLQSVNAMLELLDAWAVVGVASLEPALLRAGETDGTDDIPEMARTDNVWSQCVTFVVCTLILELLRRGQDVATNRHLLRS